MLDKDEVKVLRIVKLVPIFIIVIFLISFFIIFKNNQVKFNNEVSRIRADAVLEKKAAIKKEVLKVHDFIQHEKAQSIDKIKARLKARVREAHAIATAIYENNKDKDSEQVKKIINDALRAIRFNNNRGYFFIYETNGLSVMHPILTQIQNTSLWDFTDIKGQYVIRNLSKIAKTQDEGFLRWWWKKPADTQTEYEKIGYSKYFEPFDWFIGTGDYVLDYEEELKQELLKKINLTPYSGDRYIFIIDDNGLMLSHANKSRIGKNQINLTDENGFFIVKGILDIAKQGEGYLSYIDTEKPSTGLPEQKTSFVKQFDDWQWAIGFGAYFNDVEQLIKDKKITLNRENKQELIQAVTLCLAIFVVLLLMSLALTRALRIRFNSYKQNVTEKALQLNELNINLESKVNDRTKELKKSNDELALTLTDLKQTQLKLIETEKMASMVGLVSGVAHELNTPLGIMVTSLSMVENDIEKFIQKLKSNQVTKKNLQQLEESNFLGFELLNNNLDKSITLVQKFKSLSLHNDIEKVQQFSLHTLTDAIKEKYRETLSKDNIKLTVELNDNAQANNCMSTITEVLEQLIENSLIHAFDDITSPSISIKIESTNNTITIAYSDNGKGFNQDDLDKAFEPFYTTKRNTNCTGLGLPIVYNQVTYQLRGSIEIITTANNGAAFLIRIPADLPLSLI